MKQAPEAYDCIIVGGGPAGLSAALILGRCRRRVLLCDAGRQRNRWSSAMHGVLSRDGMAPADFIREARAELSRYDGVELRDVVVSDVEPVAPDFRAVLKDGAVAESRTLLLATGVVDTLPDIEGVEPLYGRSVHHCPICDGWEHRDQPVAVYGSPAEAKGLALAMTLWTGDVVLCTNGAAGWDDDARGELARAGVRVREDRVRCLEGTEGRLKRILFHDGEPLERTAMFFAGEQSQGCDLPDRLGCVFTEKGAVDTGRAERTQIEGLFVAGDASKDAQLVIVAAAEGAQAAVAINTLLVKRDHEAREQEREVPGTSERPGGA
ncbi:MAG: NAD(P)/FAD-dependent oxidoreductase [Gemmatimonadales bacterium]|nr:NAD(P)/FAD-dependent oxidoreductase [Gemmatimonadales bacterium]